ncbi:MAG: PAS domain-containing sensor histidine kinase [Myxococcales bacterium]|nr:PAS domain-containing sensor histidine kinase [Myxococcales bacterium]
MRLDPGATSSDLAQDVFGLLFTAGLEATFLVERRARRVVAANPACVELLGVPVDDLVGASVTALLAADDSDGRDASIFDHAGHYEDVALRQPDAPPRYVTLTIAHVDHARGGPIAACVARDTTARHALERELIAKHGALHAAHAELERLVGELRQTQQTLELRNQEIAAMAGQVAQFGRRAAIGELCATVAHNLNNPVAALLSTLRTMDRRTAEPIDAAEITRLVARARGAASRIEEHVAAVVNVHRVGAHAAAPGALDLAREVDTALSMASARLQTIQVRRGYRGPLPATVPQDPLHHVLANVLDNAIKAMPEGGTLDLEVRRDGPAWIVAVTDSGGGLAPNVAARLFEPIVTARPSGAGLGLATAQRLARAWGGDITYQVRPVGACFEISVPARAA